MPALTLYWREYCHLCHDLLAGLLALHAEMSAEAGVESVFTVELLDVDADPTLEARYDELVPVLVGGAGTGGEKQLCHYHLDPAAVRAYLAEIR